MLKRIIGTFGTRIICTLLTMGIVVINANSFGSAGLGTIGLFVLNASILQIITLGGSLVYMLPRYNNFQLLVLSYSFGVLVTALGTFIIYLLNFVPYEHVLYLLIASSFAALFYNNLLFILSRENIKLYNFFSLFQVVVLLIMLVFLLFIFKNNDVSAYIIAFCASHILSFIFSFYFVVKEVSYGGFDGIFQLFKKMFNYGFLIQIANLSQLFNYRFSYYLIKFIVGLKYLGLFEMGTKLSEAVWILPKSIAGVQCARISNCKDDKVYAKKITLSFFKLTFIFSLFAVIVLFCIPSQLLGWIFSSEFDQSKKIIYALGCGIIMLSCNIIFAHYFSGFGKYKVNTIASLIGLVITIGLSLSLIPWFNKMSSLDVIFVVGLITSLSYFGSFFYTLICFVKDTNLKLRELWINKQDVLIVKSELKKIIKKRLTVSN